MTDRWLVGHNDFTGVSTYFHPAKDGKFTIESVDWALEAKIEENKAQFNHSQKKGELRHVASIPPTVYWELEKAGIASDPNALRRWLDDPDNRVFKVMDTRLGKRNDG